MKWFGKIWNPRCCDPEDHAETPAGQSCLYCEKPIEINDQGIIMPMVPLDGPARDVPSHLDCFLKRILPHSFTCPRCRGRQSKEDHKPDCPYAQGGECGCFRTWIDSKMTLSDWAAVSPAGSRASKLIELWFLKGARMEDEATQNQVLTLLPMLEQAAIDTRSYEINSQETGLIGRPKTVQN